MQFKNFSYTKKKDKKTEKYLVMILREDETHFGGIDLGKLDGSEVKKVFEIQKQYEAEIKPFIDKAYRQYIKENVTNEVVANNPKQLPNSK